MAKQCNVNPHFKEEYMKALDEQVAGDHYKDMPIQPIEFCHKNKLGSIESSIIRYICRHKKKNGKEDLLKAKHLIDMLLEFDYGD